MNGESVFIAHISDLHLGRDPDDTGAKSKASAGGVLNQKRLEMQCHDGYILHALHNELRSCARTVGAPSDEFDFYVITGDISTSADSDDRFQFAHDYITGPCRQLSGVAPGLRLKKERVVCVPGNHDKMFESTPARYLSKFSGLPANPPFVRSVQARSGRTVKFFGIDSNRYESGDFALGLIDAPTLGWLKERLGSPRTVPHELRVLLLHHHPADLNRFRTHSLLDVFPWMRTQLTRRFTVLEEGWRLLDACRGHVHLIMHGHEHFPVAFVDDASQCLVVSAGTCMQWQPRGKGNSLHAVKISGGQAEVQQFDWCGSSFTLNDERSSCFSLPELTIPPASVRFAIPS